MSKQLITIYHSPDADDAFMFYGLVSKAVEHPKYDFDHCLLDIETLNKKAMTGELESTAISVASYPYVEKHYTILPVGASMGGEDYGPRLVSLRHSHIEPNKEYRVAIPGIYTSASLSLKIYAIENNCNFDTYPVFFEDIEEEVIDGKADFGLLIHEGQITHSNKGLTTVLDLGQWWWQKTSLPLPLGVNVAKRSLGKETIAAINSTLQKSIQYSLENRTEALKYALKYGRGLIFEDADLFVSMYVNEITLDMGETGKQAIKLFLTTAQDYNLIPAPSKPIFFDQE